MTPNQCYTSSPHFPLESHTPILNPNICFTSPHKCLTGISKLTCPEVKPCSSNLPQYSKWQLQPSGCSSQKPYSHTDSILLHPITDPSANPVGSTRPSHFSTPHHHHPGQATLLFPDIVGLRRCSPILSP